jgi:hypothetical protein
VAAIRLSILTGARVREILKLEWQHRDLERGLLLLPDSKTGAKSIILNAPALPVLAGLDRSGAYVMAGFQDSEPGMKCREPNYPRQGAVLSIVTWGRGGRWAVTMGVMAPVK